MVGLLTFLGNMTSPVGGSGNALRYNLSLPPPPPLSEYRTYPDTFPQDMSIFLSPKKVSTRRLRKTQENLRRDFFWRLKKTAAELRVKTDSNKRVGLFQKALSLWSVPSPPQGWLSVGLFKEFPLCDFPVIPPGKDVPLIFKRFFPSGGPCHLRP